MFFCPNSISNYKHLAVNWFDVKFKTWVQSLFCNDPNNMLNPSSVKLFFTNFIIENFSFFVFKYSHTYTISWSLIYMLISSSDWLPVWRLISFVIAENFYFSPSGIYFSGRTYFTLRGWSVLLDKYPSFATYILLRFRFPFYFSTERFCYFKASNDDLFNR